MKGWQDGARLPLPDCDIAYRPGFLDCEKADFCFAYLRNNVPWRQDSITVFGKTHPQPRLTAFYGEEGLPYTYSGITMPPLPFPEVLLGLKARVETVAGVGFNSCLLNLYRDGKDSNGWHADDEKELGQNPAIASISLGQERPFRLKHKKEKGLTHKLILEHGSLLLMTGPTQHHWLHQVPKTSRAIGERINLTFRTVL